MKHYNYLAQFRFCTVGCPLLLALAGFSVANTAFSATVFTDRAAFNTAAAGLGTIVTEGYEGYPIALLAGARTISLSGFRVSYAPGNASSAFGISDTVDLAGGIGPTAGSKYLAINFSAGLPTTSVTYLFATPILSFGLDIKDVEVSSLAYTTSSGATGTAAIPSANGAVQFFGIVADGPFDSLAITNAGSLFNDSVVFDQTSFVVVPEPSNLIVTALGAAIGLWFRRGK